MKIALYLIIIHFIGDFFFQTDDMAVNKSKSNYWLAVHVFTYTLILAVGSFFIFNNQYSNIVWLRFDLTFFIVINALLHWVTDFFTSRLTSYLYQKSEKHPTERFLFNSWRHWFFTAIGIDQVIHYTCLFLTYQYIVK